MRYDGPWDLFGVENGAKPMAAEPTVDARWACLVADLLEAKQIEPEGLLRQAGLSRRQVSDPDRRIPFRKHALLFELAAEACKEPYFGLRLGAQLDVREAGLLGYVALNSPTFGQALKNVVRYHRVLSEGFQLSLEFDQHHAVLAAIPADRSAMVGRQAVEFGISALVRMCRDLTAQKLRPLWVQFVLPLPRAKARYAAVLKAPVYFEQPQIAVVFSKEVLAVPVKRADHRLLRILETHCCEILGQGAESDTVSDVRQVLTRTPFGWGAQDRADGGRAEHERPHAGATSERKGLDLQTGGRRPAPPAGAPLREGPARQVVTVGFPARLFGERRLPPRLPPLDRIDADALSGG